MLYSFPADVELVMANAMYFNGKCDNPFVAEETSKRVFHGSEGVLYKRARDWSLPPLRTHRKYLILGAAPVCRGYI